MHPDRILHICRKEDRTFDMRVQGGRVQLRQGKNSKHVHCPCRMAKDIDVRVGEWEVIHNPLHSMANILSCSRELDTQVDETVVWDDSDEPMGGEEGPEVLVDYLSRGRECTPAYMPPPYEKTRIRVSGRVFYFSKSKGFSQEQEGATSIAGPQGKGV
ncbi:hypothetical protein IW261DRAFT_1424866 [Armillaria novae-zelandiae]|uniref:Uncharacterized protein n=1 Tax=Armillaria novae-zelandiae TaxID=153914 RepID=A0AA39UAP5_9AGAR|nr:hypothetical protein IW261DRAFT_1424866 [Armillaria novae-zelandiae]